MFREILTLVVDNIPTQYYINFGKERREFSFQPTLKNRAAPSFMIIVEGDQLVTELADEKIAKQAKEKVSEILGSRLFDKI
jgi:hypothetical protein